MLHPRSTSKNKMVDKTVLLIIIIMFRMTQAKDCDFFPFFDSPEWKSVANNSAITNDNDQYKIRVSLPRLQLSDYFGQEGHGGCIVQDHKPPPDYRFEFTMHLEGDVYKQYSCQYNINRFWWVTFLHICCK